MLLAIPSTQEDSLHFRILDIRTLYVVQVVSFASDVEPRDSCACVCVLQVALDGEGEDFLPKAWGKFH